MSSREIPDFCPHDGASVDVDRREFPERRRCPSCGDRWYGSPLAGLLWRLPPSLRERAVDFLSPRGSDDGPGLFAILWVVMLPVAGLAALLSPLVLTNPPGFLPPFGLGLLAMFAALQVGIVIHEEIHRRAFRYVGVSSRIEYLPVTIGPVPVAIVGGKTVPRPSSWRAPEWQHALVGFAPLVLIPAAWGFTYLLSQTPLFASPYFHAAAIGFGGGIFYCGIPSSSDAEVALSSIRYWYYTEAERSEDHRLAEGYPR